MEHLKQKQWELQTNTLRDKNNNENVLASFGYIFFNVPLKPILGPYSPAVKHADCYRKSDRAMRVLIQQPKRASDKENEDFILLPAPECSQKRAPIWKKYIMALSHFTTKLRIFRWWLVTSKTKMTPGDRILVAHFSNSLHCVEMSSCEIH